MKTKIERYKTAKEFGTALGLSDVEMELIHQKKKLIEKLKEVRIKRKLSQQKLAELVGSKQPAIARMESGQISEVSLDFLVKVALILGVIVSMRPLKKAA
ncbi:MAG: helix-turn-helix transcriptional regulator [Deltaproteobacteria bacterium]|nr:helix-turn-helix transcriptional regulator [Deltaproteobacteria bacterium]